MARRPDMTLEALLSRVTTADEEKFELDDAALPHLFRVIYTLAPKWHQFSMQLGVPDIDQIRKDGRCADDCLVLALQNWLRQENTCWKDLIKAIYQPAGGGNQLLAKKVSLTFRDICKFQAIASAKSTSTDIICGDDAELVKVIVGEIQEVLGGTVAARWYQLGTVLGTPVGELEMIRATENLTLIDRQSMMLEAWLMCLTSNKTWQWLVDSIAHQAGGKHPKLAKKIADLHPAGCVKSDGPGEPLPPSPPSSTVVDNPIDRSKTPNMIDLRRFPTTRGHKNLIREIGGNDYKTFGTLLLKDESSAILDGLVKTHNGRVDDITHDILKIWITEGRTPVTWDSFMTVLRDSCMNSLAELMESGFI